MMLPPRAPACPYGHPSSPGAAFALNCPALVRDHEPGRTGHTATPRGSGFRSAKRTATYNERRLRSVRSSESRPKPNAGWPCSASTPSSNDTPAGDVRDPRAAMIVFWVIERQAKLLGLDVSRTGTAHRTPSSRVPTAPSTRPRT